MSTSRFQEIDVGSKDVAVLDYFRHVNQATRTETALSPIKKQHGQAVLFFLCFYADVQCVISDTDATDPSTQSSDRSAYL